MIRPLFIIIALLALHGTMQSQEVVLRETRRVLIFDPASLDVVRDSTGYVQQMIRFFSSTGDTISVTSVNGSCRCANGSVQRPFTHDSTAGKIYLAINAKHFTDSVNYVDYTIGHTGANTPSVFRVIVRVQP